MNIVIFGLPRSGTSTLKRVIENSGVKLAGEPFNRFYQDWNKSHKKYRVTDIDSLKLQTDDLAKDFDGFKTLTYQLNPELNKFIIDHSKKLIFTYRNPFDAAFSSKISTQTKIWQKWQLKENIDYSNIIININELKQQAIEFKKQINLYSNHIKKNRKDAIFISYDKMYSSEIEKKKHVELMFSYLNLSYDLDSAMNLTSKDFKLNQEIPKVKNIEDILNLKSYFLSF